MPALTGHLVLTTLHTETAAAAVPRLLDLGVEGFLLKSTLRAVIAQRLVRQLCDRCKTHRKLSRADFAADPRYSASRLEGRRQPFLSRANASDAGARAIAAASGYSRSSR